MNKLKQVAEQAKVKVGKCQENTERCRSLRHEYNNLITPIKISEELEERLDTGEIEILTLRLKALIDTQCE